MDSYSKVCGRPPECFAKKVAAHSVFCEGKGAQLAWTNSRTPLVRVRWQKGCGNTSPCLIGFILLLSTLVGFGGGIWPARRAARMNPLKALRYK